MGLAEHSISGTLNTPVRGGGRRKQAQVAPKPAQKKKAIKPEPAVEQTEDQEADDPEDENNEDDEDVRFKMEMCSSGNASPARDLNSSGWTPINGDNDESPITPESPTPGVLSGPGIQARISPRKTKKIDYRALESPELPPGMSMQDDYRDKAAAKAVTEGQDEDDDDFRDGFQPLNLDEEFNRLEGN